jgi:hypothetical protein
MAIQQYPEPAGPTVAESYGISITAGTFTPLADADDAPITNPMRALYPLDSIKIVTPGIYQSVGTQSGVSRWSVKVSSNPTVLQSFVITTASAVNKLTTTGTLFGDVNTAWPRNQYIPPALSTGRFGEGTYADGFIAYSGATENGVGGFTGRLWATTDGTSWTEYSPATTADTQISTVNKINNRWVVSASNNYIYTSTNLTNWSTGSNLGNRLITMGGNTSRLVGASTSEPSVFFTSTNAINWSTVSSGATTTMRKIKYVNNFWFAMGDGGIVRSSTNGTSWNTVTAGFGNNEPVTNASFGNGIYIMVSAFGNINVSTDGVNWTTASGLNRYSSNESRRFYVALFNRERFIVNGWQTANADRAYTSTNGIDWSNITQATTSSALPNPTFVQGVEVPVGEPTLQDYSWVMWAIDTGGTEGNARPTSITTQRPIQSSSKNVRGAAVFTLNSSTLTQVAPLNLNYTTTI